VSKVFEIISGTVQHEKIVKAFTWKNQFDNPDFQREFQEKIGVPFYSNCSVSTRCLMLERIPDNQEGQFSKNKVQGNKCTFFKAKKNSNLQKSYESLIRKHQIQEYRLMDFDLEFNLVSFGKKQIDHYSRAFERFFIVLTDDAYKETINDLSKRDYLKEVPRSEFLRLQADYLDFLDKEQTEKDLKKAG
jgi:hypothetical protein